MLLFRVCIFFFMQGTKNVVMLSHNEYFVTQHKGKKTILKVIVISIPFLNDYLLGKL